MDEELKNQEIIENTDPIEDYELRALSNEDCELRASVEGRIITGYGIVFNSESKDLGGFVETIGPEAANNLIATNDILSYLDHDKKRGVLARSNKGVGSMQLSVDSKGVKYSYVAPKTPLGDETIEGIKRGDIGGSSVGFKVAPGGATLRYLSDGRVHRHITKFAGVFDMGPVYQEAYPDATVALRNIDEFRKSIEPVVEHPEPAAVEPAAECTEVSMKRPVDDLELSQRFLKQKHLLK